MGGGGRTVAPDPWMLSQTGRERGDEKRGQAQKELREIFPTEEDIDRAGGDTRSEETRVERRLLCSFAY